MEALVGRAAPAAIGSPETTTLIEVAIDAGTGTGGGGSVGP